MRVITISGKAQHGKDTTASIIKEKLEATGYRTLIIHYADLLKYMCKQYFGWNGVKDDEGRRLLQRVGTDVVRAKDDGFWVDSVRRILSVIGDCWDYVLIPDTRFPNEVYPMGMSVPGLNIRVCRSTDGDPFDNGLTEEQKNHASETSLDDFIPDIVVYNDGDIDKLRDSIDVVMNEILGARGFRSISAEGV